MRVLPGTPFSLTFASSNRQDAALRRPKCGCDSRREHFPFCGRASEQENATVCKTDVARRDTGARLHFLSTVIMV